MGFTRLDDAVLEGCAAYLFWRSEFDPCAPPDPLRMLRALGITIVPRVASGCGGAVVIGDPPTVRVSPRGSVRDIVFRASHEASHLALMWTNEDEPHDEHEVDEIARRLLVPTRWVRRECLERGQCIEELPALAPLVEPRLVIARARHVLGLGVANVDAA